MLSYLGGSLSLFFIVLCKALNGSHVWLDKRSRFIRLMAPFFFFYYFQSPLQATLQALNLARAAMINSLIGAIAKTAVIFLLASQPAFGIFGVAMGLLSWIYPCHHYSILPPF